MKIITINSCTDCPNLSHTGVFTTGGAKPCCNHIDITTKEPDCFKRTIPYRVTIIGRNTAKTPKSIPSWCPLEDKTVS